jgi:hypothetical protein
MSFLSESAEIKLEVINEIRKIEIIIFLYFVDIRCQPKTLKFKFLISLTTDDRRQTTTRMFSNCFSLNNNNENNKNKMIDLLILGGGWTFNFLDQLLLDHNSDLSYISTTRDGRNNSIKWSFDDDINADPNQFLALPIAKTVLIVFPLKGLGPSSRLLNGYQNRCNIKNINIRWIQLGSSGIWDVNLISTKLNVNF